MADPICRWRNVTIKQVSEFTNILPHSKMPVDKAKEIIIKNWLDWDGSSNFFRTPYQLAVSLGLYYMDEQYYYPRFSRALNMEESRSYIQGWIKRYYVPNPYTVSVGDEKGIYVLNTLLLKIVEEGQYKYLKEALENTYDIQLGNEDIISNMLETFSDIHVDEGGSGRIFSKPNPTPIDTLKVDVSKFDKKAFFNMFNDIQIDGAMYKEKSNFSTCLQQIFYGAPGTGKSHKIKEYLKDNNVADENIFRTTFHPDSDYSTFVGAYKPSPVETGEYYPNRKLKKAIGYSFVPQAFMQAYMRAYQTEENVYLVIEEINRGNCAQIFGDLFQLLDRDKEGKSEYSIKADRELCNYLKQELGEDSDAIKGGELCLPPNLFIWATMNTSDQSLFPIDSAFKRRWDWDYQPIGYKNTDWKIVIGNKKYSWISFQKIINDKIFNEIDNSEDKQLGDFFVNANHTNNEITAKTFLNKVLFYLWNDVCKDDPSAIFKTKDGDTEQGITFSGFFQGDMDTKLQQLMAYLGIEPLNGNDEEDEEDVDDNGAVTLDSASTKTQRFMVNGEGSYKKGQAVKKALEIYIQKHPGITTEDVARDWNPDSFGLSLLTETEEQRQQRFSTSHDTKPETRTELEEWETGKIYIRKGWNPDSIQKLVNGFKSRNWDIDIQLI